MAGTGRVYQRGDVWWIDYAFRGQRRRESSGSHLKRDAVALLRKRQAEMGSGRLVGPSAEKVTLEDLAEMLYADHAANNQATWRAKISINHLLRFFGPRFRAMDLTTDRVNRYIAERRGSAAPATVHRELATLKRMFALGLQAERLLTVPYIPTLRISNAREGFFESHDLEKVIHNLPKYTIPVVRFAALTGWRKSEILSLQWSQVDWNHEVVRLEPGTTKNREGREFPFSTYPALKELLQEQWSNRKAGDSIVRHVFHRDGEKIGSFRKAWATATKAAGVPNALFHDLRRTAVRNLEQAGVPRSVAMKLTGHKTEAVYRRYAIADRAALKEGVDKLAQLRHSSPHKRSGT